MSNSIKKMSDNRYVASFSKGSGVNRVRHHKVCQTKRIAEKTVLLWEQQNSGNGALSFKRNCSVASYFRSWYQLFKRPKVGPSTDITYKLTYKHLTRFMGDVPLNKLNRAVTQNFFNQLGRRYSLETCRKDCTHLKSCLENARYDGLISKDFLYGINLTGSDRRTRDDSNKYLSHDNFNRLQQWLFKQPYASLTEGNVLILAIIAGTGARVGEVIGLKWDDLDSLTGCINIERSYNSTIRQVSATKTTNAVRSVPMIKEVDAALGRWRTTLMAANGDSLPEYIFDKHGINRLPKASSVNAKFKAIQKLLKIESRYSPHSLRHTLASVMVKHMGVTYTSKMLGHANPAITETYYLRELPGDEVDRNRQASMFIYR